MIVLKYAEIFTPVRSKKLRSSCAAFAALLLLGSAGVAESATVTENLVGMISGSNTTDTLGLFGPAGANLTGQPISIYFKYTTDDFTSQTACRSHSCVTHVSKNSPNTPGSVLITVSVNGQRHVYAPVHYGAVLFQTVSPDALKIYSDCTDYALGYTGAAVYVPFLSAPTFGSPLSPTDDPLLNQVVDYVSFYSPSTADASELPSEQLSFFVSSATK